MIASLTNTSGGDMNGLDVHDGGSGAVGGQRSNPFPYPFGHIGVLADSAVKALPMHPSDWRYKRVPWLTHEPKDEWNTLIKADLVTLGIAAQTDDTNRSDREEFYINLV
jgi:hypothetical protein